LLSAVDTGTSLQCSLFYLELSCLLCWFAADIHYETVIGNKFTHGYIICISDGVWYYINLVKYQFLPLGTKIILHLKGDAYDFAKDEIIAGE